MVDESLGDAAEVFEQTPNQSLRSMTLQIRQCASSQPGSTLSKNNHTNKDVAEPPASALPECSARPGPAGHAPASAHHAPAARRARTPTASHTHPHGSPQMSHVIPRTILQTLKFGRCNSNVFSAHQKLTEGNYVQHCRGVRVFGEERLPPADEAGTPQADTRIVVAREPPATPVTPVGAPGNPRPRRDAPFVSTRPGLVQRSQPQYANPLGCSAKTANPGLTTSKPLAL